jgi:phosphoribosylanthranilate isomerase
VAVTRFKICCIRSIAEARLAIDHGASALGLVSHMPSGPGVIPESTIAEIAAAVPPAVSTFLLTSLTVAEEIVAQHRRCRTSTLQLVDWVTPDTYAALRAALPGIAIVQVVHVTGPEAVDQVRKVADQVDGVLLDSGNPALPVKELGGTGRVHDWDTTARIQQEIEAPIVLAGGLRPDNVAEAIDRVRPFGVDVCSGVRTDDRLDPEKLAAFVAAIREADRRR